MVNGDRHILDDSSRPDPRTKPSARPSRCPSGKTVAGTPSEKRTTQQRAQATTTVHRPVRSDRLMREGEDASTLTCHPISHVAQVPPKAARQGGNVDMRARSGTRTTTQGRHPGLRHKAPVNQGPARPQDSRGAGPPRNAHRCSGRDRCLWDIVQNGHLRDPRSTIQKTRPLAGHW